MEVIGSNGVPEFVASKVSPAEVKPGEYYVVDLCCIMLDASFSFVEAHLSLNHAIWFTYLLVTITLSLM